jgi:hypothetical protein
VLVGTKPEMDGVAVVTPVTRPLASTVMTGMLSELPYVPGVTPVAANWS